MPLVSIVMPVYNAQDYLEEALESIIGQTYPKIEIIIVDDNSSDSSLEIVRQFKVKYKGMKIKIVALKRRLNSGGDRCANEGIKFARGKYIARMDADDIATPKRIETQVEFLESHTNTFLVGSNAYVIDKEGKIIGEKLEPLSNEDIYKSYFRFHPLIHPTCMFRRLLKNKSAFKYQIKHSANNDYLTFFKLICKGYKFANIEEKLLYFRVHGRNATFENMKKNYINTLKIRIHVMLKYRYIPSPKDLGNLLAQTAVVMLLPEKTLLEIYFMAKGIKPINPLSVLLSFRKSFPSIVS